jgi:hypothetical protein
MKCRQRSVCFKSWKEKLVYEKLNVFAELPIRQRKFGLVKRSYQLSDCWEGPAAFGRGPTLYRTLQNAPCERLLRRNGLRSMPAS